MCLLRIYSLKIVDKKQFFVFSKKFYFFDLYPFINNRLMYYYNVLISF